MASYADQIKAGQAAHLAVNTLAHTAEQQIITAFTDWAQGSLDKQTIRHRLEAIVRSAYRSSAAIAAQAAMRASDLPDWAPAATFNNDYLQQLLRDVRKNLRAYKNGDEAAQRAALLRIQFSAQVGAQRGFNDQQVEAYTELEDFGYEVEKAWMANFVDNVPCDECRERHGTVLKIHEDFPAYPKRKTFVNRQAPPAHPRCSCFLVMLIRSLENVFDKPDFQQEGSTAPPSMLSTEQVQKMPAALFHSVIAVLKSIIALIRRKK